MVYIRHCVLLDKTVPTNSQHEGVERLTVDAVQGFLHSKSKVHQLCQMMPAIGDGCVLQGGGFYCNCRQFSQYNYSPIEVRKKSERSQKFYFNIYTYTVSPSVVVHEPASHAGSRTNCEYIE